MNPQTWSTVTPVQLASTSASKAAPEVNNPLPQLLQTPSGLAILELQGTINFPQQSSSEDGATNQEPPTHVGRLIFPLYTPGISDPNSGPWMKRVYFYIGQHQRMTGEIKKLVKPIAILRKAKQGEDGGAIDDSVGVVEVIKHKIVFASRPEPVSADME